MTSGQGTATDFMNSPTGLFLKEGCHKLNIDKLELLKKVLLTAENAKLEQS